MLKAELKKTWSRPLIFWAFIMVCMLQVLYVDTNYSEETKVMAEACNDAGGQMDDTWRTNILLQYEQHYKSSPEVLEDIWMATKEQRAILIAFEYVHFTEL